VPTPSFRTFLIGIVGVLIAVGVVGGSLALGKQQRAEASQIRADALVFEQQAAQRQAARERAAAEQAAQDEVQRARAAESRARRQRAADERAAAEQAAREEAARQQTAAERAARKAAREAAREEAREEARAEAAAAAVRHVITGELTVPDIGGALVTQIGGQPGQALSEFDLPARKKFRRLLDSLEQGRTYPCPDGSGGRFSDIVAGAQVTIEDGAGKVLATSTLTGGLIDPRGCTFTFSAEVSDADLYRVAVAQRGGLTFSRSDLEANGWKVLARL
jgi:multidrug efflux pump subunit AcrA (membrane-fusion protein)